MRELFETENDEEKITIYFLGVLFSYIAMLGGLLVFVLLIVGMNIIVIGSFLTAYLSSSIGVLMTFLHRPLEGTRLRKVLTTFSVLFLLISISLFLSYIEIF